MTSEDKNKPTMTRITKEIARKLKLVAAARGNGESAGTLIGSLIDKEMHRLNIGGNNNEY